MTFENTNYFNDPRVRNAGRCQIPTVWIDEEEVELPWKWGVCPTCQGAGSHVNPSIDCGGLSADAFAEDPDFAEDYHSGVYDQVCSQCNGRTTVPEADLLAMTPWQRQAYEANLQDEASAHAEHIAEVRMGA